MIEYGQGSEEFEPGFPTMLRDLTLSDILYVNLYDDED